MSHVFGLEFSFKEFMEEIQSLAGLADELLTRDAVIALGRFKNTVRQLGDERTDRRCELELLALDNVSGIRTRSSDGEYEKVGRKGKEVSAELRCKWEVQPIGATGKKRPRPRFRLVGLASTSIAILDGDGETLARWHMDIADDQSPGCYFHVQVSQEDDMPPFPAWLPVPRFPSLFVTPMAALDFVLGELFQDRWLEITSTNAHHAVIWRTIQKKRWEKLLGWHRDNIESETCSPWIGVKRAQPPSNLFEEKR